MHLNSELIFKKYGSKHFSENLKVLEIGPSGNPSHYCKLVNNNSIWHTLDIDTTYLSGGEQNTLHIKSNSEYNYPIDSETFDIVLSGQVMEHVSKIWVWIKELERITKPGGKIILISPISWPYHEAPIDCWRIYPDGMKALVEDFTSLKILLCKQETLEEELIMSPEYIPGTSSLDIFQKPYLRTRRKIYLTGFVNFFQKFILISKTILFLLK